jgi:antitoxin component YwqK of YwqJK toxin-antitoxin module
MEKYDIDVRYYPTGEKLSETYYLNGLKHRIGGPAYIVYHSNGNIKILKWYENDKTHNVDDAAFVSFYENGKVHVKKWYLNDLQHRDDNDKPAWIHFNEDGSILYLRWFYNDHQHRVGKPAVVYYKNKNVSSVRWVINSKSHREEGPAEIYYNDDGSIRSEKWYLNGKELSQKEINYLIAFNIWKKEETDNFFQFMPLEMMTLQKELLDVDN